MVEKLKSAVHGVHGLKSASILLMITLFLSNVLGLLRNMLLANRAGSLSQLEPYYAAFRLPDLIFNILVLGAIASAFIPVYAQVIKEEGDDNANHMANTLLGNLLVVVIAAMAVLWITAPIFVPHIVSGYPLDEQLQTIHLTRIMLLSPFFFSLSYIAGAILNSHKRFFSYSIAPLIYNLSIIIGAILLPRYGVEGVAWSVVIGSALHFIIQVPTALKVGYRFVPAINFKDQLVSRIIILTIPRTFSLAMAQILLFAFTYIASHLHSGALSIFSLANDLQTTPAIIFGASLATAVFPTLSEAAAEKSPEKYQWYLMRTLRVSLFAVIPLTVLTFLLRAQVIRLYIGLGHNVNWVETIRAINTLTWFTFSFIAQCFVFILARAFYALQDTKRPMYAALLSTLLSVGLAWYLPHTNYFGQQSSNDVAALAAAYTAGMWLQAVLLIIWLPSKWKGNWKPFWNSLEAIASISLIAGCVTWVSLRLIGGGLHINQLDFGFSGLGTNTIIKVFVQATVSVLIGGMAYTSLAKWFRLEEWQWLLHFKEPKNNLELSDEQFKTTTD